MNNYDDSLEVGKDFWFKLLAAVATISLFFLIISGELSAFLGLSFIPIWFCLLGVVYFIPGYIAFKRQKINWVSILILNILLGWTFIGWVVALVWATMHDK